MENQTSAAERWRARGDDVFEEPKPEKKFQGWTRDRIIVILAKSSEARKCYLVSFGLLIQVVVESSGPSG